MQLQTFLSGLLLMVSMASHPKYDPYEEWNKRRVPLAVTAQMDSLWNVTKYCSGRRGDIKDVNFFIVHDEEGFAMNVQGRFVLAYWLQRDNSITFHQMWATDSEVIKHEMLHALRQDGLHIKGEFTGRCGLTTGV